MGWAVTQIYLQAPEQREIFSQMLNACVACHTDHAAKRFPAFHQE